MIIWAFFIIIIFNSFINSYFMKIIKKPIIEDKLIYRVIVIKKCANSITKIWYLWFILLLFCVNQGYWAGWIKGQYWSCWRIRSPWRKRVTSSRGNRRGLLWWRSRARDWGGNWRIPSVELCKMILDTSPILSSSRRRASPSSRCSWRRRSKQVHRRYRIRGCGLSIARKNCISWSLLNNWDF